MCGDAIALSLSALAIVMSIPSITGIHRSLLVCEWIVIGGGRKFMCDGIFSKGGGFDLSGDDRSLFCG